MRVRHRPALARDRADGLNPARAVAVIERRYPQFVYGYTMVDLGSPDDCRKRDTNVVTDVFLRGGEVLGNPAFSSG